MKKINGFSIINSKHDVKPNGEQVLTILGVRVNNTYGDNYEYVVAQPESVDATEWPSGRYYRTLDLALVVFNQTAGLDK